MTVLFSDDFESGGLANWTGTNGTIAANGTSAHTGSFGCEANSTDAFAFKDFTAPASQFVSHRSDVKIVSASGTGKFRLLQISQGSTSIALLIYDNGTYKLQLRNSGNVFIEASVSGIVTGTWQQLRIDYDWSPGQLFVATAYVDGVQAAQLVNNDLGGVIWHGDRVFILTFEDVATGTGHLYFDNVSVDDTAPAGGTTYNDTGGAAGAYTASAADAWTMIDAGQALSAWMSGALDTMTMTDAGGGVLIAVASGSDGSAPAVQLPYQGDATIYDSAGATGSVSGGTILATGTIYDSASATGSVSGATIMPVEATY